MKYVRDDRGTPGVALAEVTEDAAAGAEGPTDDASTRQRVQQSIMQHGPSTAVELAERLELTPAAIRRHLQVLLDRGYLESRQQRIYGARGRGRPAKVFALTDSGRRSFHQAYDDLAVAALKQLVLAAGDGALVELARTRVATVEQRYRELRAVDPDASPVEALAQALTAEGYVASRHPALSGEQLCQHHCPVAQVAEQFPQLCEAETELFGELLGVPVQRLATIAHGDGVCTTHISQLTTDGKGAARPPKSVNPNPSQQEA